MKMGSDFKKSIFDEHIQVGLVGWAQKVKRKNVLKAAAAANGSGSGSGSGQGSSTGGVQLASIVPKAAEPENIRPSTGS